MKNSQLKIKNHYEIAENLIKINQKDKAKHEIFNKMSKDLYDLSLDISENRNALNVNLELKELILNVLKNLNSMP